MKWMLLAAVVLVVLVAVVVAIGSMLPRDHEASRTLHLSRSPDEVWALVSDFEHASSWRPDVTQMERVADRGGKPAWIEHGKNGRMPFEVIEAQPPRRLVTNIGDRSLPFGGTWTYEIAAEPGGSALTITERGWVSNPVFRFVSRVFMDPHATIDLYLKNLADRLQG